MLPTLDDLLADARVDCVVNLTPFEFHAEVTGRALQAGKHVHTEKPVALDAADAQALVELADRTGLSSAARRSRSWARGSRPRTERSRKGVRARSGSCAQT